MLLTEIQSIVQEAIAAGPLFNGAVVLEDDGHVRPKLENAIDISSTPPGPGWAVSVWPPTKGSVTEDDASGFAPTECIILARVIFNPQFLTKQDFAATEDMTGNTPDGAQFVTNILNGVVVAVLSVDADPGGTKFQLARDFFEMIDFDEGLLAFHIRFKALVIFGQ